MKVVSNPSFLFLSIVDRKSCILNVERKLCQGGKPYSLLLERSNINYYLSLTGLYVYKKNPIRIIRKLIDFFIMSEQSYAK